MTKRILSCGMFLGLVTVLSLPLAQVSAGNWNTGNKTERSKVAPGVYVERKVNKKKCMFCSRARLFFQNWLPSRSIVFYGFAATFFIFCVFALPPQNN